MRRGTTILTETIVPYNWKVHIYTHDKYVYMLLTWWCCWSAYKYLEFTFPSSSKWRKGRTTLLFTRFEGIRQRPTHCFLRLSELLGFAEKKGCISPRYHHYWFQQCLECAMNDQYFPAVITVQRHKQQVITRSRKRLKFHHSNSTAVSSRAGLHFTEIFFILESIWIEIQGFEADGSHTVCEICNRSLKYVQNYFELYT